MGDGRGERQKEDGVNWLIQKRSGSEFLRKFLSVLFKSIESGLAFLIAIKCLLTDVQERK